jgi:hypothetical protein
MYLSMHSCALAPQLLTLCARQVDLISLSNIASYTVCQTTRPTAIATFCISESKHFEHFLSDFEIELVLNQDSFHISLNAALPGQ